LNYIVTTTQKNRPGWTSIRIRNELHDQVVDYINSTEKFGVKKYGYIVEFVQIAVLRFLEEERQQQHQELVITT
jgi:hypothetical protein